MPLRKVLRMGFFSLCSASAFLSQSGRFFMVFVVSAVLSGMAVVLGTAMWLAEAQATPGLAVQLLEWAIIGVACVITLFGIFFMSYHLYRDGSHDRSDRWRVQMS